MVADKPGNSLLPISDQPVSCTIKTLIHLEGWPPFLGHPQHTSKFGRNWRLPALALQPGSGPPGAGAPGGVWGAPRQAPRAFVGAGDAASGWAGFVTRELETLPRKGYALLGLFRRIAGSTGLFGQSLQ